jgi:hypothetical protein
MVARAIGDRTVEVGLRLHRDKTKIVYCKRDNTRGQHKHTAFTFLGYTFRARGARTRTGIVLTSFAPAISKEALRRISETVRRWRLDRMTGQTLADLARWINPIVRAGCSTTDGSTTPRCAAFCNASTPT